MFEITHISDVVTYGGDNPSHRPTFSCLKLHT